MNELGKYISKIRQERNLTQKELADRMHLHVTTISKWENGNSVPNLSYFEMLAEALEITTAELFECRKTETEPEKGPVPESGTASDSVSNHDDSASCEDSASCDNVTGCNPITKYIKKFLPILISVILLAAAISGIAVYRANSNELKYKIVDEYLSEDADYFGFNTIYNIIVEYDGTVTDEFLQAYQHKIRDEYKEHFKTADLIRIFFINKYAHVKSTAEATYELFILPMP